MAQVRKVARGIVVLLWRGEIVRRGVVEGHPSPPNDDAVAAARGGGAAAACSCSAMVSVCVVVVIR